MAKIDWASACSGRACLPAGRPFALLARQLATDSSRPINARSLAEITPSATNTVAGDNNVNSTDGADVYGDTEREPTQWCAVDDQT